MTRYLACLALSALSLSGCALWDAPMPDPDCSSTPIDAGTELLNTAPWLRGDPRAQNATRGAFSFAGQLAALCARYPGFDARTLWNLINGDAATPASQLPFRLLGLVNRTDLAEQLAPESPAGEARLVYTLTLGPGDDSTSAALPLTVIFEYSLGSARSARDWAAAFHALAKVDASMSQVRADAASALVTSFIAPVDNPGAAFLSQIRVNDGRSGTSEFYELALDDSGALELRGLRNTPRSELAETPELVTFIHDNAAAIQSGTHRVPASWLAESAPLRAVDWLATAPDLQRDFSRGTCTGCHGDDGPGRDGFHLVEAPDGQVALSRFLTDQDLPRRASLMRERLCAN